MKRKIPDSLSRKRHRLIVLASSLFVVLSCGALPHSPPKPDEPQTVATDKSAADRAFQALRAIKDDPLAEAQAALDICRRFPADPRSINLLVNLSYLERDMAPADRPIYRHKVRALLAELIVRLELPVATRNMIFLSEVRREMFLQNQIPEPQPAVLRATIDRLAELEPGGSWRTGAEEIYVRQLVKVDPAAAEAYLRKIIGDGDPNTALMAQGELNVLEMRRKPLELSFTALDGRTVDTKQLRGKVVLVDFWATWCGICVKELPRMKALYEEYRPQGFEIVGIAMDEEKDRRKLLDLLQKEQVPWPQQFEGKRSGAGNRTAERFNVTFAPVMFLLDREGKLVSTETDLGKLKALIARQFERA